MPWLSHSPKNEVVNRICDRIWLAVVQRTLRPGARLKEEDLAAIFNATRARVRQALTLLEQDGLVSIAPNRGACIAEPDIEDAHDAFATRLQVEQRLITRLCRKVTPEQVAALRAHVMRERAAHRDGDGEAMIRLSGEFHMLLAAQAGGDLLQRILRTLTIRTSLITAMYQTESVQTCGPDEHARIVDAIAAQDARRAIAEMAHHLQHLEAELRLEGDAPPVSGLRAALLGRAEGF